MNSRDIEQQRCIQLIREHLAFKKNPALVHAATGYGKGRVIAEMAKTLTGSMIVIVPRVNLVSDLSERIEGSTIYCATLGKKNLSKITVATKQSISLEEINTFDVCVLDEAHRYDEGFLNLLTNKFIIGFTATPYTANGVIYGNNKFFKDRCYICDVSRSIQLNFLCDYKIFDSREAMEFDDDFKESDIEKIAEANIHKQAKQVLEIETIAEKTKRKKIAILCATIKQAESIFELILDESKCLIHSQIKNAQELIADFKGGKYKYCVSVLMLSEGFDEPSIDCVVFLRPTKSAVLMQQAAGRGLRIYEEKEYCLLLDYGRVFMNCGTPRDPIIPSESKKTKPENSPKRCEKCFCVYDRSKKECPECGHTNKVMEIEDKTVESLTSKNDDCVRLSVSRFIKQGTAKNGNPYWVFLTKEKIVVTVFRRYEYVLLSKQNATLFYNVKLRKIVSIPSSSANTTLAKPPIFSIK